MFLQRIKKSTSGDLGFMLSLRQTIPQNIFRLLETRDSSGDLHVMVLQADWFRKKVAQKSL